MGEEVVGVTGGAGRHTGSTRHRVVMDVFRQDAAALQEDSDRKCDTSVNVFTVYLLRRLCCCVAVSRHVRGVAPVGEPDVDVRPV